jgi:hypothetical protein
MTENAGDARMYTPVMSVKMTASMAFIGMVLLTFLLAADCLGNVVSFGRGLIPTAVDLDDLSARQFERDGVPVRISQIAVVIVTERGTAP